MTLLPVIARDLRIRSRRRGTYWLRVGVALVAVLVCVPQLISSASAGLTKDIGKEVFDALAAAAFILCCGACLLSSDAIAIERREGTLGLLLLTRVRGLDLLLGKFGSCALAGLCAMAAFVPVLTLPILAGGVAAGEAARKSVALLNTLSFALAVGLYASSVRREQVKAGSLALLILGFFVFVPWFFWLSGIPPFSLIGAVGPLVGVVSAGDSQYSGDPSDYWESLAGVHIAAWMFLFSAGARLRKTFRFGDANEVVRGFEPSAQHCLRARVERRVPAYHDPIGWLVRNQPGIRRPLWWAAWTVVIYMVFSLVGSMMSGIASWLVYGICSAGTDALLAVAAGRFFIETRKSGQLEMLLTTPIGATTIVNSQWTAMKALLGWPVAIWISAVMLRSTVLLAMWSDDLPSRSLLLWGSKFVLTWFFDVAGTILGVYLVCWLGMWIALLTQSRLSIAAWAAALSTGCPALLRLFFGIFLDPILNDQFSALGASWPWLLGMWFEQALVLIYYFCLYRFVRRRVFRELSGATTSQNIPLLGFRFPRPSP